MTELILRRLFFGNIADHRDHPDRLALLVFQRRIVPVAIHYPAAAGDVFVLAMRRLVAGQELLPDRCNQWLHRRWDNQVMGVPAHRLGGTVAENLLRRRVPESDGKIVIPGNTPDRHSVDKQLQTGRRLD